MYLSVLAVRDLLIGFFFLAVRDFQFHSPVAGFLILYSIFNAIGLFSQEMKNIYQGVFWLCMALTACNPAYQEPESAMDAGRQFINAIYQGNFKRANQLIEPGDANVETLRNTIEKDFRSRDSNQKEALSQSSIQINRVENVDANTTLLYFTNAYNDKPDTLKIKTIYGKWLVDLQKSATL